MDHSRQYRLACPQYWHGMEEMRNSQLVVIKIV